MKRRMVILAVVLTLLLASGSAAQEKVGTGFTYQGFLKDGGSPANGAYDFEFWLYDTDGGGTLMGGPVTADDVVVADGLFTVLLDFGADPFAGGARWLEIRMRPGASTEPYTTLVPRQALTSVPTALYAMTPAGPEGPAGPGSPSAPAAPLACRFSAHLVYGRGSPASHAFVIARAPIVSPPRRRLC